MRYVAIAALPHAQPDRINTGLFAEITSGTVCIGYLPRSAA